MTDPTSTATRPGRNPLGIVGFVLVMIGVALPVVAFTTGIVSAALEAPGGSDDVGWAILGGVVVGALGVGLAAPFAIAGAVLCIVALTRHARSKVLAIIGLVVGVPGALLGLATLPLSLDFLF